MVLIVERLPNFSPKRRTGGALLKILGRGLQDQAG